MKIHAPNAELVARRDWTDGLATFTVRPKGWTMPDFVPGQFANLALPAGEDWDPVDGAAVRRPYSIASPPGAEGVDFFVRRVDGGELTPRLFELELGSSLFMEERAAGHFTLEGAQDAEILLFVGTGTGVAPYRSMLLDPDSGLDRFRRIVLVYSDRTPADIGHAEEFEALAAEREGFTFLPTLTRADDAWDGLRGRVQGHLAPEAFTALLDAELDPERVQVFLCGNPEMVTQVVADLDALGFKKHRKREPGQVHFEKYW